MSLKGTNKQTLYSGYFHTDTKLNKSYNQTFLHVWLFFHSVRFYCKTINMYSDVKQIPSTIFYNTHMKGRGGGGGGVKVTWTKWTVTTPAVIRQRWATPTKSL